MSEVATVFGLATLVIFVGFLSELLFEKTRVPDVLILVFLGVVLGPVTGLLDAAALSTIAPLFGALALALILFDGGLELKYEEVVKKFGSVLVLIAGSFVITTLSIGIAYRLFLPESPPYLGLALGALLSAVSAPIVIPLLSIMIVKSETKTLLHLESALTDAAAIIVVFGVLGALGPTGGTGVQILGGIAATIVFSTIIALILGIAWLELLKVLRGRAYSYMITLAAVLGLFSVTELLGGTGAVAALVFGIVLSNGAKISRRLPIKTDFVLDEKIRWFHSEVTFFLKTFFFVYVGVIFSVGGLTPTVVALSIAILAIVVAARLLAVNVLVALKPEEREDQDLLNIMLPRGLTSVVLASIVATTALVDATFLVDVTFVVIVLTNVVLTAGVFLIERRRLKARVIPPSELEQYFV